VPWLLQHPPVGPASPPHPRRLGAATAFPFLLFFLLDRASSLILCLPAAKSLLRRLHEGAFDPVLPLVALMAAAGKAAQQLRRRQRTHRTAQFPAAEELRRGTALIAPRHLPGNVIHIAGGLACDEQLGLLAVPGQRHIARPRAPMFRMIEVCLVEGPALAFIYRARIAMPEPGKRLGVKGEQAASLPVEAHGNPVPVDALNDARVAVIYRECHLGAGELNPVAGGKIVATMLGLKAMREAEFFLHLPHAPQFAVQRIDVGIRVREHGTGLRRIGSTVRSPFHYA
jgi:hypothetical protein